MRNDWLLLGETSIFAATNGEHAMDDFEKAVHTIQFLAADAVEKANSGHPGTPMALAGITVDIFTRYLRYDPRTPEWPNRDRFVLSCGHASMLLYGVLHLAGYDLPLSELENFRQWGSKTPGHPEHGLTPGVETTTGPLGQGVGNAVGLALASKLAAARLNQPGSEIFGYRVFALASDGDLMEGVSGEASSIAGHLGLDNLVFFYDDNKITIDGSTDLAFSEDVGKRYEAYGWFVQHVNGHAPEEVRRALDAAVAHRGSPSLIVARTTIGIGAPTKAGTSKAHGAPLGQAEIDGAKKAAGWPLDKFYVAPEAKAFFGRRAEENRPVREAWERLVAGLSGERAEAYKKLTTRAVPSNLFEELATLSGTLKADATRILGAAIEQKVAALVPAFIGGAADLAESTKTTIKGAADVKRGDFAGRNLNFGIREHGMAAVMNGLAVSGLFIPFGSSFLQFTDYCRPSIRLAALMEQQVVYVFTHDSIFLGEDGPTHQPVEHLWALRLIPNLDVVRPADPLEVRRSLGARARAPARSESARPLPTRSCPSSNARAASIRSASWTAPTSFRTRRTPKPPSSPPAARSAWRWKPRSSWSRRASASVSSARRAGTRSSACLVKRARRWCPSKACS